MNEWTGMMVIMAGLGLRVLDNGQKDDIRKTISAWTNLLMNLPDVMPNAERIIQLNR